MPDFKSTFPTWRAQELGKVVVEMDDGALALLRSMLVIDPERRISAKSALRHPYFHAPPSSSSRNPLAEPLSPFLNPWGTTGPPTTQQFALAQQQLHPHPPPQQQQRMHHESPARSSAPAPSVEALMASPM
ncbi:hypothetical protein JCM1841_001554 [Sporobolomyces salmonicolor]